MTEHEKGLDRAKKQCSAYIPFMMTVPFMPYLMTVSFVLSVVSILLSIFVLQCGKGTDKDLITRNINLVETDNPHFIDYDRLF